VELITKVDNVDELTTTDVDPAALSDPVAGPALRAFLILTQYAEWFMQQGWSADSVFWSRYYWFKRFALLRKRAVGFDAGIEQQAFQILEHPFPNCEPDWSDGPSVEGKAANL
jgi:hypothetical protein